LKGAGLGGLDNKEGKSLVTNRKEPDLQLEKILTEKVARRNKISTGHRAGLPGNLSKEQKKKR